MRTYRHVVLVQLRNYPDTGIGRKGEILEDFGVASVPFPGVPLCDSCHVPAQIVPLGPDRRAMVACWSRCCRRRVEGLGRPREVDFREVLNAILYLNRSGCQWDMLPHDLPPKSTVYDYFAKWRDDGTWQRIMDALRSKVAIAAGRDPTPSAASIDSQSVKTTAIGGERGYDGGKKVTGRKRHVFVDTLGLLLAVTVTAASVDDAAAVPPVARAGHSRSGAAIDEGVGRFEVSQSSTRAVDDDRNGRPGTWKSFLVRQARKDSCCCRSGGSSSELSVGTIAGGATAKTTNDEPTPAKR